MLATLLLAVALSGNPPVDPEKFDCKAMKKQVVDACLVGCDKQAKDAKKNGEKPPNCGELCEAASSRMDSACKTMDKVKSKAGSAGGSSKKPSSDEGGE